jgi:hypothetical protein
MLLLVVVRLVLLSFLFFVMVIHLHFTLLLLAFGCCYLLNVVTAHLGLDCCYSPCVNYCLPWIINVYHVAC